MTNAPMAGDEPKDILISVGGKPFRCECGCNVFRHPSNLPEDRYKYVCNSCRLTYTGEPETEQK